MSIRIVVGSYHRLLRQGLRALIHHEGNLEVVGEALDGAEMVIQVKAEQPDVVIMDLGMPKVSGLIATRLIRNFWPGVRVLALASSGDEDLVYLAMKAGAWGHVSKETEGQALIRAIKATYRGEATIAPFLAHLALQEASAQPSAQQKPLAIPFSESEITILGLVEQGVSPKVIGARLGLSPQTLSAHLCDVFFKLPLGSDFHTAVTALQRQLLSQDLLSDSR